MSQKILNLLGARIKITLQDNRIFIGQLLAFDRYMNLVLLDTQEIRITKAEKVEKRTLGLVILRGEVVVSISVESYQQLASDKKLVQGLGVGKQAGRGLPVQGSIGLQQPVLGMLPK